MIKNIKIKKMNLADQVFDVIKQNILTKEWEPGFRIPSENELADMFDVNRLTIRMALQKLNVLGIVETRVGEGTFVRKFSFLRYMNEVSDLIMSPEMLDDVLEFREHIEIECMRLAIERANSEDIAKIEQCFDSYQKVNIEMDLNRGNKSSDESYDKLVQADLDFHYQICESAKNTLYSLAYASVREPIFQYLKAIIIRRCERFGERSGESLSGEGLNAHKKIVEAIKNRDFKACKAAYLNMIDYKK